MNITLNVKDLVPNFIMRLFYRTATDKLFDRYAGKVWRGVIIKTGLNSNLLSSNIINRLASSNSCMRIYYSFFYSPRKVSFRNLVLSVGMELLDNHHRLDSKVILQFSRAISENWFEEILENEIIRERLENKTGKKFSELKDEFFDTSDKELLEILSDETKIRTEFFLSYSTNNESDDMVRVFLPNKASYIDWNKELSVLVSVNSFHLFELGFFRVGYDYGLLSSNRSAWVVTISKDRKREVVLFGDQFFGKLSKEYIWAR